jgi:ketopantoate reductase
LAIKCIALVLQGAAAKCVEVFAVTDIVQRMWEKLVHPSTAAAMTCLMRANVGDIVRTPNAASFSSTSFSVVPPSQPPTVTRPARAL